MSSSPSRSLQFAVLAALSAAAAACSSNQAQPTDSPSDAATMPAHPSMDGPPVTNRGDKGN